VSRYWLVKRQLDDLTRKVDTFPDFVLLAFWDKQFTQIASVNVFFAWLKLFKYVSFNETMAQLSNTLTRVTYTYTYTLRYCFCVHTYGTYICIPICTYVSHALQEENEHTNKKSMQNVQAASRPEFHVLSNGALVSAASLI
jgi:hypothetical protein